MIKIEEIINFTVKNVSKYIYEDTYNNFIINGTKIINDVCVFEYEQLYYGNMRFLLSLVIIFIGILLTIKIISKFYQFDKKYFGIDNLGFYVDYKKINETLLEKFKSETEYFTYHSLKIVRMILINIFGNEREYLSYTFKMLLLLIIVLKLVFINCQIFGTIPILNMRCV